MSDTTTEPELPRGDLTGFRRYIKHDLLAGFLVFLIALPLCLGISQASGFPPIAGVFTAIIGAILATFISNSELTIKGPAAGLIVIAIGCIEDFGGDGMVNGWSTADATAYQAALAVGAAAAICQVVFGFSRAGIIGEFFPVSAVRGMLAAIGVIIVVKQLPTALGVSGSGTPLEMIQQIPNYVAKSNPLITLIGSVSLVVMFVWPSVRQRIRLLGSVPAPMVVLVVSVLLSLGFDLDSRTSYTFRGSEYALGNEYLVAMPDRMFGMFDQVTFPKWSVLSELKAWKWVLMFFIIGSLESLLSTKAVDLLDPWKRKTELDRDMIAVGVGNCCASVVGGLPMISEIVRSKANVDNGARTRFSNFWHGVFLLACVALIPTVLHRIPLAALAAMLIYTGYRLAHPTEFLHTWRTGKDQFLIFVTTLIVVLATDLLIGVTAGIVLKMAMHLSRGVSLRSLFKPFVDITDRDDTDHDENVCHMIAHQSLVFSNWIPTRRLIERETLSKNRGLIFDLSKTHLVDRTVIGKLDELKRDFDRVNLRFEIRGMSTPASLVKSDP